MLTPDAPATHRASLIWNAAAIACVLVLASSFALAGKNYGEIQKAYNEFQEMDVQRKQVISLSNRFRDGQRAWDESLAASASKQSLHQIAERLKGVAASIDSVPQIDERSTEIRKRIVEVFNKRAGIIESAGKGEKAPVEPSAADLEEADKVFDDYFDWETSILEKYGLTRGKQ